MLYEFLLANRGDLLGRCRTRVDQRHSPEQSDEELKRGIPLFLYLLI